MVNCPQAEVMMLLLNLTYCSGHKIVPIVRTEVYEDALCGLLAWESLNGLSNKGFPAM